MSDSTPPQVAGNPGKAVLFLLAGVNFLVLLDVTIINVALPSIGRDLSAGGAALQWLVSGYTLTYALGLLPSGRGGDRFGPHRLMILGLAIFALGSAACGLAPTIGWLQAGRVVQGIGAAMISPQALALAHRMFQGPARAGVFAIFGLMSGLASVMGPLVGGWLVDQDLFGLGWRPIFLINPPLAAILALLMWGRVSAVPGNRAVGFDPVAVVLSAAGLLMVLVGLIEGRETGWPAWVWGLFAAAPITFALLLDWERRRARLGRTQLIPAALTGWGDYIWHAVGIGMFFAGLPGFFVILALFLQTGFGFTPLQSGVTAFPLSLGIMVASILAPVLKRVSPRIRVLVGGGIILAGLGLVLALLPGFAGLAQQWQLMAALALTGLGFGTVVGPLFHLALEPVPEQEAGVASALMQALQQVGGAFGVAVMGSVFFARLDAGAGWTGAFHTGATVSLACFAAFLGLFALRWLLAPPPVHT